mmetsp:Transcript_42656/g.84459  ORF Transcript_42656/g.84459 Transcript_42656/m.84459 type:complete len:257 (-) Transcript_42656:59-829(-)
MPPFIDFSAFRISPRVKLARSERSPPNVPALLLASGMSHCVSGSFAFPVGKRCSTLPPPFQLDHLRSGSLPSKVPPSDRPAGKPAVAPPLRCSRRSLRLSPSLLASPCSPSFSRLPLKSKGDAPFSLSMTSLRLGGLTLDAGSCPMESSCSCVYRMTPGGFAFRRLSNVAPLPRRACAFAEPKFSLIARTSASAGGLPPPSLRRRSFQPSFPPPAAAAACCVSRPLIPRSFQFSLRSLPPLPPFPPEPMSMARGGS